jgi:phospholipase A1
MPGPASRPGRPQPPAVRKRLPRSPPADCLTRWTPRCPPPASLTWLAGRRLPRPAVFSDLSRFWELEIGQRVAARLASVATGRITVSVVASDSRQPPADAPPPPEHTRPQKAHPTAPRRTRIQLSVRTKLAQGLLTQGHPTLKDSLWFGYTQQSYWQLFTPAHLAPIPLDRPRARGDVRVSHRPPSCPGAGAGATAAWAWCTSPTARATRCRAAGTVVYLMTGAWNWRNRWNVTCAALEARGRKGRERRQPRHQRLRGPGRTVRCFWNVNKRPHPGRDRAQLARARGDRGSVRLEWMQGLGAGLERRQEQPAPAHRSCSAATATACSTTTTNAPP